MSSTQILQEKSAVMFGAGGSKGAAVAKEFAAQGAELFLSGHTKPGVESVAKQIAPNGGRAQATVIDTLDDAAGNQYIDGIAKQPCRKFSAPPGLAGALHLQKYATCGIIINGGS